MQKVISHFFMIVLGLAILSAGCKKDKDQTRTDMLTSGQWKVVAFTINPPYDLDGDGDLDSDLYAEMEACERDDFYIFRKDGKYEINDGQLKCDPMDPQVEVLDWSFTNGEQDLILDGDQVRILELTNSKLRLSGNTIGVTAEVTFGR